MKIALRPSSAAKTFWSFLSTVVICATLAFAIYKLLPDKKAAPARRLWTPLVINNLNTEMIVPAKETKDAGDTNRNWEVIESEEPVTQFGQALRKDADVVGYRRSEVWGHGRTALKPGWWWSITVRTNYPVAKLAKTYREFWKTPSSVFVEVIDNRGHDVE
jgi:hypothetical protein